MPASPHHKPAFARYPLTIAAACCALGVLLGSTTTSSSVLLSVWLVCGVGATLLAGCCFLWQRFTCATMLIAAAFAGAGATLVTIEKERVSVTRVRRFCERGEVLASDPVEVTGVLRRAPETAPDGFYLALNVEALRIKETQRVASGTVWLFAPLRETSIDGVNGISSSNSTGEDEGRDDGNGNKSLAAHGEYSPLELRRGARLRVMTRLTRDERFHNPGGSSFAEYLERRGFDATGMIKSPLLIERLDDEPVLLPLVWLDGWREGLLRKIDELFSRSTAGVLKAALLGNRYGLSRSTAERFREGGTFHVLVISGMHISVIGAAALWMMKRLTKRAAWQFAVAVGFLWTYTVAVGAEVSVSRAALMFTVAALAPVVHRQQNSLNALGGATLLLLVWRPTDLFDPAFQLTFLSVLAILTIAWPLLAKLKEVGAWYPTSEMPHPPTCPPAWRTLGELLFWSERRWRREVLSGATYDYRLFKTPLAARLEGFRVQRPLRYVCAATIVSSSVQLMLLPLLVLYFHRLALASLILNTVVGILMSVLIVLALAAVAITQLNAAAVPSLVWLAERVTWLMVHSVDPLAETNMAQWRLPEYTGWAAAVYGLYYLPLLVLIVWLAGWKPFPFTRNSNDADNDDDDSRSSSSGNGSRRRALQHRLRSPQFAAAALILLLIVIVWHPLSAARPDGRLRIDFLDVGQGDAALVTMPDGVTLLIDGGGQPRYAAIKRSSEEEDNDDREESFERDARTVGEAVVSEYLWWRGLSAVDYILATHAHADHIDGLNDVARNFGVGAALVARAPVQSNDVYRRFAGTMAEQQVPVSVISKGDVLRFDRVEIDVLWPPAEEDDVVGDRAGSINNDSIVLRLRYGQRVFLLTGDVESEAEAQLIAAPNGGDQLRCDVLKVAHHGSRTSSTDGFVNGAQPTLAVISVGRASPFNHPHREVVERLSAGSRELLTTGEQGTITVSTDGRDLQVKTFVHNEKSVNY